MTHESLWEAGTVVDGLQISDGEVVDSGSLGVETSLLVGAHSQMEIGATSECFYSPAFLSGLNTNLAKNC
jgi:hypothetical protein